MVAQSASPYFQLTKKLVSSLANKPDFYFAKRESVSEVSPQSHQTAHSYPQWWEDWKSDVLTKSQEEAMDKACSAKVQEIEDVDPVIEWVFVGVNITGERVFENLNEAGLMMIGDDVYELVKIDTKD
jgi:hypothetical protein